MSETWQSYPTQEDAIAAALAEMADGDTISVHSTECALNGDDPGLDCSCRPMIVTKGARA